MADHDAKVSVSQHSFDRSWLSGKSTNAPGQTSAVPPVVVLTESLSRLESEGQNSAIFAGNNSLVCESLPFHQAPLHMEIVDIHDRPGSQTGTSALFEPSLRHAFRPRQTRYTRPRRFPAPARVSPRRGGTGRWTRILTVRLSLCHATRGQTESASAQGHQTISLDGPGLSSRQTR
jgi:hypothetical protein